jgi:hypothetical protein
MASRHCIIIKFSLYILLFTEYNLMPLWFRAIFLLFGNCGIFRSRDWQFDLCLLPHVSVTFSSLTTYQWYMGGKLVMSLLGMAKSNLSIHYAEQVLTFCHSCGPAIVIYIMKFRVEFVYGLTSYRGPFNLHDSATKFNIWGDSSLLFLRISLALLRD